MLSIVREAQSSHVFGIEADVFFVGRHPNFLDPEKSLSSIRAFAEAAHKIGNKAFVYMAGPECTTPNAERPLTLRRPDIHGCRSWKLFAHNSSRAVDFDK